MPTERVVINTANSFNDKILLVDDDPLVLKALDRALRQDNYDLITANSGEEAIKMLEREEVAVIVCNLCLPRVSGIEVLKQARTIRPQAIKVILTGASDLTEVIDAVNTGHIAQFIQKPWEESTLRQTINSSVARYRLLKDNKRLHALNLYQHRALILSHDSLKRDLKVGSHIHEVLLRGKTPENLPSFDIDTLTLPSAEIDGDFYDFYQPSSHTFDVVIGDVMGKGIPAALVGTAVKTLLMRFAVPLQRTQIFDKLQGWRDDLFSPREVLEQVHEEMIDSLIDLEFFVSLFYARFDLRRQLCTYVDCGSAKPLHYRAHEKQVVELQGKSFPLGVVKENSYQEVVVPYSRDDVFVFYSDGLSEAKSPEGSLFGTERLISLVRENATQSSRDLIQAIRAEVMEFCQRDSFDDDLTIIVLKSVEAALVDVGSMKTAKFTGSLSQLASVRKFVEQFCKAVPGNSHLLSLQLKLAVNEIFCNTVKHGYGGESRHPIVIEAALGADGVMFEIADQGEPFDPAKIREPSLSGDRDGGFGLYIIQEIADSITYAPKQTESGWNRLRLFKRYCLEGETMELPYTTEKEVLVVTLDGANLDAKEASQFKQKMSDIITTEQANQVVFDLSKLQFVDSSGLGGFLSTLRLLNEQGGDLKLAGMSGSIRTMFEIVRMHKLFEIFNTTDEAVRSFD